MDNLDDKDTWVDPLVVTPATNAAHLQQRIHELKQIRRKIQHDIMEHERELAEMQDLIAQGFDDHWPVGGRRR